MTFTREMILELMRVAQENGGEYFDLTNDNLIILNTGDGNGVEFAFDENGNLTSIL